MKYIFGILFSFLLLITSCTGPTGQLVTDRGDEQIENENVATDCSYFYFLWARTSEAKGNFDEALEAYQKAMVCDPEDEYLVRRLAALLIRVNRKKQALDQIEKLIARNPDDKKIKVFQADLYSAVGEYDKAIDIYKKVLSEDPANSALMEKLGKQYLSNLDYTQARIIFEKLVQTDPDSLLGHYYLAQLYRELKYYRKSFVEYAKALEINWSVPLAMEAAALYEDQELFDDAIVLYRKMIDEQDNIEAAGGRLVRIYLELGESDKALKVLQEVRSNSSDTQRVDLTMGRIFLEQKKFSEAIEILKKLSDANPELSVARSLLAYSYYESGDLDSAKALSLKVKPDDTGYDDSVRLLIEIYSKEENVPAAIDLVRKAIEATDGNNFLYYSLLSLLYEKHDDLEKAEDVLKEAISLFTETTDPYIKYGMFLEKLGRSAEAMTIMQKVLSINSKEPFALNYVGYTWADQGQNLEKAMEYILEAVRLLPEDGFIRDSLGWVYYKVGDFEKAAIELKKAVIFEPEDPTIHEHLADVYLKMEKMDLSSKHYQKSLEFQKKDNDKARIINKLKVFEKK